VNIRQKFITVLLLIGVVPMLVVSTASYLSISNSLRNKTVDQLNSTAIKQEQKINTFLQTRQEEVTKLANQYDLQVALLQYVATPDAAHKQTLDTILQNKKIEVPLMQSVFLTNLEGKVLASSSSVNSEVAKDIEGPKAGEETTVMVKNDPNDGFSKLYVTTLVSVNKQRTALLNVVFRTDELVAIVQDYTGLDETGETLVAADDNISLFPLRFNTEASLKTNISSLDLANMGNNTYKEALDYRGNTVLVVAHTIGLTDWKVATKIDKSEALAATITLRNGMIGFVIAVCIGIVVVALFLTRVFTRPIRELARVSESIGRGNFDVRAKLDRRDELGTLASSINGMGDNLSKMVGNIESQRMRLQVILDSTTETIFAIDEHANVILVNQAVKGLLQADPAALAGKNMRDLFAWQHGLQSFDVDYAADGVRTYSNLQYLDSTATRRYVKLIVARIQDKAAAGRAHAIVTIHDETSSHELENMKTDFVSMAAHELRTPLTAVRGYLEMVQYKQEHNDTQDVDTYVRQALKNVSDLGGLINNLLDVTRIERGTFMLTMEKVDIAASIARLVEDQRFAAEDKQLTLTRHGAERGCYVVGDPIALREVVNNLLSNAIKYTQPNGKVDISLAQKGESYSIEIKDTGIGIPAAGLKHLFTKFYRVHGGLDSGSTGTGLGLYIAKSIAERHQGSIKVVSEEGVGSTFTVTLPIYTEQRMADTRPNDETKEPTTVRRKRGWITKNITR